LEIVFANPVAYLSFYDIDSDGTTGTVFFVGGGSENFVIDGTATGGASAEFFGIYRNSSPPITRVRLDASGSPTWGIDEIAFGLNAVPEPSTVVLLSAGMLLIGVAGYRRIRA
jgi:hypothetical protein